MGKSVEHSEYLEVKKQLKKLHLPKEVMEVVLPFLRRTSPEDVVHSKLTAEISNLKDTIDSLKERNRDLRSSSKGEAILERDAAISEKDRALKDKAKSLLQTELLQEALLQHQKVIREMGEAFDLKLQEAKEEHRQDLITILQDQLPEGMKRIMQQVLTMSK